MLGKEPSLFEGASQYGFLKNRTCHLLNKRVRYRAVDTVRTGTLKTVRTTRVVDPYSFFPDPDSDPEFDVGDQYGYGSNPDPDPIRIQGFNDQKLKKNYS